jgi:hypothetical protein
MVNFVLGSQLELARVLIACLRTVLIQDRFVMMLNLCYFSIFSEYCQAGDLAACKHIRPDINQ